VRLGACRMADIEDLTNMQEAMACGPYTSRGAFPSTVHLRHLLSSTMHLGSLYSVRPFGAAYRDRDHAKDYGLLGLVGESVG
jgi:hypothetical protein